MLFIIALKQNDNLISNDLKTVNGFSLSFFFFLLVLNLKLTVNEAQASYAYVLVGLLGDRVDIPDNFFSLQLVKC